MLKPSSQYIRAFGSRYFRTFYVRKGVLMVEALLGIVIFGMFVTAIGITLLYGQEGTIASGDRVRASYLSRQAIAAARSMRDISFASLTPGKHGVALDNAGQWVFSGSSVFHQGAFTTILSITTDTANHVFLSGATVWKHALNRSGSVLIDAELYDWRSERTVGNWESVSLEGSVSVSGSPQLYHMKLYSGSYLFVAARSGNGLYIFDVTNTASPQQINTSFSLGVGAYKLAIAGSKLFIATDDSNQEIRVYDISNPATFSASNLLATYNVQGSGRARSLVASGDRLYMGGYVSGSAGHDEFYAFSVADNGTLTVLDSVNNDSATINSIFLSGTAAYLASSMDTGELRVINVASGTNLVEVGGYNVSDRTLDGMSVSLIDDNLLLGTEKGSSISELVLFDVEGGILPSPPPGPWYKEGSGTVMSITTDPRACVAFFATDSGKKALQIINMSNTSSLPELYSYNSTFGKGRAVYYEPYRDRLFFVTESALLIFAPGTTTGTCP